jgi:outer membrane protein OmpA-like peptidoglycan-associated protein
MDVVRWACVVGALSILGCSAPGKQLTQCQAEKDELLAALKDEKLAKTELQTKVASLESRLDQSETQLARLQSPGTRVSTRPGRKTAPAATGSKVQPAEQLPWREHGKPAAKGADNAAQPKLSAAQARGGVSLAALARHDSRLDYDDESGVAQVDLEIPFEPNSARLDEEGRRSLDDLAHWLQASQTSKLRVLVAGYAEGRRTAQVGDGKKNFANSRQLGTARAQAVADYLDRHGISEERLGVTGVGSSEKHFASKSGQAGVTQSVQIFVAEPDATLVGWGHTGQTLRR